MSDGESHADTEITASDKIYSTGAQIPRETGWGRESTHPTERDPVTRRDPSVGDKA